MPRNRDTGKHLMFDVFSNTEAVPWERVTWFKCMELVLPALDHGCWAAMSAVSRYKRSISPPTPPTPVHQYPALCSGPWAQETFHPSKSNKAKGAEEENKMDGFCYGLNCVCPKSLCGSSNPPGSSECACIWRQILWRGEQGKMRSYGES